MAYERQYYTNGDVLNAEQLNHMEAGIKENSDNVSKLSEEKVSNPSTGEVGQILEIETVDEKGKPKTYKAVNKPTGGEVSEEQIAEAVENYLTENPVQAGATTEQANQIESNKQDIAILKEQVEDLSDRENSVSETMVQSIVEEYMDENSQAMATLTINGQTFDGSQDVNIKLDTPEVPKMEKLTFTGAVDAEYDGSTPITVNIPNGSSDSSGYTLPVATSEKLGGVKPVAKDDTMTQEVGVDSEGKLYTAPNTSSGESSNGLGEPLVIETITFDEATQVIYKELDYSLYKCVYFTITQATNGTHGIYIGLRNDGLANFISLGKIYNAGTGFVYPLSKKSAFCSWNTGKGAVTGISTDGNNAEGVAVFSADITGIKFVNNDNWQVGDVITIYGVKR